MRFFTLFLLLIPIFNSFSQVYTLNGNLGTITTCNGTFYDSGGAGGSYTNNEDYVVTFCSGNGLPINLNFTQFQLEANYDFLYVYNGPNTSSPLIGTYNTTSPGLISASSGCITIYFHSDYTIVYSGWEATISCGPVGPTSITATSIGICSGQSTTLTAIGGSGTINWYANACGTTNSIGTGAALVVSPTTTTTYFANSSSNGTYSSNCVSTTINVSPISPAPTVNGTTALCGNGSTTLTASNSTGPYTWYANSNGTGAVSTGATFITPSLATNTTYYVGGYNTPTTSNTTGSLATTQAGGNGCGSGNMFDITAGSCPVIINGFTVKPSASGTMNVAVYYKSGTYSGFQTNAGSWTLLGNYSITATAANNPTYFSCANLNIPSGATYGIYVAYDATYTNGANTYTNGDITITTGLGLCSLFGNVYSPRTFNGTVHYQKQCNATCPAALTPVLISVNQPPVVNAGLDQNICSGQSVNLTGTATATGGFSGPITVNIFSGSNLDETTWTITNSLGQVVGSGGPYLNASNNTSIVNSLSNPPFTFTIETQGFSNSNLAAYNILCGGSSISGGVAILTGGLTTTIPISGCPGPLPVSASWTPSATLNDGNILNPVASPSTTTTYTLSATANGCTATDQVIVTVAPGPSVSVNNAAICSGQTTTLTATPSTTGGTYLWSPGGQTTNSISVSPSSTTNYSVVYTLNGCSSGSETGTVTVTPGPSVSVPPVTFCPGSSVTLSATASPSGGTYLWTPGGQTTSSIAVSPSATSTYNVSYTVPGCPTETTTATATLANTLDWANIQWPATSTICQGQNLTIYGQVFENGLTNPTGQASGISVSYGLSTTNSNPATWPATAWTTATYNPLSTVNPNNDEYMGTLSGLAPGTYYYAFSYTYNGCTVYGGYNAAGGGFWNGTTNVNGTLTVTANVTPNFTAVSAICAGTNLPPLPTSSTNNISGTWSPAMNNSQTTTYTFTPNAGVCATNSTMTITVNQLPTAGITNNSNTTILNCLQTSIALSGTGGGSYSWSNGSSVVGTTATLNVTSPGIYTLTVTNSANCTSTATITITQDIALPQPSIANSATVLTCTTTSSTLTATGGGTYSWSNGTTVLGTNSTLQVTVPGTYTVTVTGSNGCAASASSLITQNITAPSAVITNNTGSNILTCNTTSISLSASGGLSYSWNNGAVPIGTTTTISITTPGTYTLSSIGANGCSQTASISITQDLTLPIVNITSSNGSVINCNIPSLVLSASGVGTYEWEESDNILGTTQSITVSTQGEYNVSVTGSNGCTNSASFLVTQNTNPPTASITSSLASNQLTCSITSITLSANGSGTYSWSQGATNLGNSATISVVTPGTYNLIVTGSNGCTATTNVNITQSVTPPSVLINANPQTSVLNCSTTSLTLTASGGSTYSWSNGTSVVGTTAALLVSNPGTYTVTVTGVNGCSATASSTVTQDLSTPTISITNNTGSSILNCTTTNISLNASGGTTYSWSNGTSIVGTTAALGVNNPGTYTVTATGANGCTATSSITITQTIAVPSVSITNAANATELTCALTSIALTANGGGTYSWSNGSSNVGTSSTLAITSPGTYTVTVTGANGCSATASTTITQNITPPTAGITNNPNTTTLSCTSNSLTLTATGGSAYSWIGGGTNLGTNPSITVTAAGTYTVTVTGNNGCTSTASTTINQNTQAPTVSINATANGVLTCSNTSITLIGSSSTGSGTATWLNGTTVISNGPISGTGNIANLVVSAPGTYTLNILEANGCIGTTNYTVTQNITTPTAVITNNSAATLLTCSQNSINVVASGASTYSWSNGTNNVGNLASLNISTPGTYTVTATGANGCIDTEQIIISQNITAPSAAITNNTGATQLTCTVTSISLTATGGGTYSWSNGTSVVGTNATLNVTAPGTYTVTITASNNGCTNTSATTISQNIAPPTVSVSSAPNTTILTCSTTSIALTASGGSAYTWISVGNNLGNNASINVTSPGTYTVTATGANGCTASVNTTITQNTTAPTAAISNLPATNELTCTTTTINLTATGGVSYSWSNGTNIVGTNATLSVNAPGTYTVTVTGSNGCTATASAVISQNITAPVAAITNNSNTTILTCFQTSITVVATGGASYAWSNGTSNVGNLASLNISTPGTYTVTATAANGCTDSEVITVTQNIIAPTATITNTTNTTVLDCNTTSISLTANGGTSYSWTNGPANLGSNATINLSTAGTYILTATAANGCTDTETIVITSQANANPTFTQIAPICTGTSFTLPTTSTNNVTGSWSPAPNLTATTTYTFTPTAGVCANTTTMTITVNPYPVISTTNDTICNGSVGTITTQVNLPGGTYSWVGNTSTQANLSISPSATTSYTVIYNLAGCNDTTSAQLIVNPVPVVQVQNATICAGQTGLLIASANLPNGSYSWSNGSTTDTISLTPLTTTTQTVSYTLNGCTSAAVPATLTVNPVPSISMNNQSICFGNPVTMTAVANPVGTYYWGPNAVQGAATNTFTPSQDTTLEVFNVLNGCSSDTIQATVTVLPLPVSTFTANILEGCVPLNIVFTADVTNNTTYNWQTSNQLTASGAQANLEFDMNGSFAVTLNATLNGCSSSTTIPNMINVDNYPIAAFEPSSQVFTEPNQTLSFWNNSLGATSYVWNFGDGGSSNEEAPSHLFEIENEGTTVVLYAYSNLGCMDTASYFIGFDPGLVYYIPNTFTPDGDHFNQTFVPIFTAGIDPYNYQMLIYNRWGEVIFESLNPEVGWDGTYGTQGKPVQSGTYTYLITVKVPSLDERKTIKGHVNLLR